MAKFDYTSIWRNVKELDLQPIREAASRQPKIAIIGAEGAGKRTLAAQLRIDPRRPDAVTHTPLPLYTPELASQTAAADLVILILDVTRQDISAESQALDLLLRAGQRVIIFHNKIDLLAQGAAIPWLEPGAATGKAAPRVYASATNWGQVRQELIPAAIEALPGWGLALGRHLPIFRETVARNLISETCTANAAYSFSTGIAEIIPVLGVPLNIADIIVLTKAQAILVYKLGLALGMPADWQFYLTELGGVIGGGFLWRQVARSLVGLIPAWGIVPKVAVAYSGTYAVGQAVLVWYLTGKHATKKMLAGFTKQAAERGKQLGRGLTQRARRSRRNKPALPPGEIVLEGGADPVRQVCPQCGTVNDADAKFCKGCAQPLGADSGATIS
jgi:uncharacterized protein (DUF697 family)/signal recognition particle receptor subunit beta